jgi:ribose transport system permease protein
VTVNATGAAKRRQLPRLRLSMLADLGIVITFVGLFAALSLASSTFLTSGNLLNILDQWSTVGIIAFGGTLVLIAGGFDLSVGAIFAISGVVAAKVANAESVELGVVAGIAIGLGFGIANGLLTTIGRINPFIATLGSAIVIRGLALVLTGGFIVTVDDESFSSVARETVALLSGFILNRMVLGRYIFAVGNNAEAARLSGVRVSVVRGATYAISGLCAGVAGVIGASRVQSGQADVGVGIELTVIAAIVLGGTSILGGEGAIWRTAMGVLILAMIGNGLNLLAVDPVYQDIIQGGIVLLAVAIDGWTRRGGARI